MILNRITNSFKRQDWFIVFVQLLIVIVGVYVGIYIGESADKRALKEEVNQVLKILQAQLTKDLQTLEEIVLIQTQERDVHWEAISVLSQDPVNEEAFGLVNRKLLGANETFFPNTSAYQTLRDLGYLAEIEDTNVQLAVTNLFDRIYTRHDVNSKVLDRTLGEYYTIRDVYWDRIGQKFINNNKETIIRMRNGLRNVGD